MTREEEIKKLIEVAKQKSKDRDFEFTDDEVVNLPFSGSYEYGFASGAMTMAHWKDEQFAIEKQQMIERAWDWLTDQKGERTIDDFKKAMEDEQ